MTEQNRMRHSYAIVKKFLNKPIEDRWEIAHNAITDYCDFGYVCDKCSQDDMGYCGLRGSSISDFDRFVEYCGPVFLSVIDNKQK